VEDTQSFRVQGVQVEVNPQTDAVTVIGIYANRTNCFAWRLASTTYVAHVGDFIGYPLPFGPNLMTRLSSIIVIDALVH